MTISLFEKNYPNINRWVNEHEGWIQIGADDMNPSGSFLQLIDSGGMYWEGKTHYETMEKALMALDQAAAQVLKDIYGD